MPAAVGNAIYDYVTMERPLSEEAYIFSMQGKALPPVVTWIGLGSCFKSLQGCGCQAGRRGPAGNAPVPSSCGISPCGNGIARPVISETLGHTAPKSLDCYLSADIQHLREYALSIKPFPVSEEVLPL